MNTTSVRVRFAPSPTGFLHVGGLRTALFNYLWAKKNKGVFVLRIEDTDRAREVPGSVENILEVFKTFDLKIDEGPVKQSDRLKIYQEHIQILLDKGAAYKCYCDEKRIEELKKQADLAKVPFRYDKYCLKNPAPSAGSGSRNFVVRQNVPESGFTEFDDLVYEHIRVENRLLEDGVLVKSDGWPVYNFANVVDDHLMQISHVIRGQEFIPSTPKHILLYQAFDWNVPQFVHLPLLLNKEKKKLSKRDGDVAVKEYLEKGYLPEAILNFIAFLGWNPKTEQEIFSLDELVGAFDLLKINKAGAVFDLDKLQWFNAHYIKQKPLDELMEMIKPYLGVDASKYPAVFLKSILETERERLKMLSEIGERVKYFFQLPEYDASLLRWKNVTNEQITTSLQEAEKIISSFQLPISKNDIEKAFLEKIGTGDKGTMLWPLRVALSGLKASPGPFEIISVFLKLPDGKEIIAQRIQNAIAKL